MLSSQSRRLDLNPIDLCRMPRSAQPGGTIVLCTLASAALGPPLSRCEETCQAASRQRELVTGRRFAPNSLLEAHWMRFCADKACPPSGHLPLAQSPGQRDGPVGLQEVAAEIAIHAG